MINNLDLLNDDEDDTKQLAGKKLLMYLYPVIADKEFQNEHQVCYALQS